MSKDKQETTEETTEETAPSSPFTRTIDDLSPAVLAMLDGKQPEEAGEEAVEPEPAAEQDGAVEMAAEDGAEEATEGEAEQAETPSEEKERFTEAFERLVSERQELAKQREEYSQQIERLGRIQEARNHYDADKVSVIRDYIGAVLGSEDDDVIDAELESLYEDLTRQKLGLEVDSTTIARRETAKLRRELEAEKRERLKAEEQAKRKQLEEQHQQAVQNALSKIGGFVEAGKDSYPFLMLEDNPSYVVWDVIATHYQETGDEMSVSEATQRAEEYLKKQALKYKQLFTTSETAKPQASSEPEKPRKAPSKTPSLTNASASEPAPLDLSEITDPEERKRAIMKKYLG